MAPRKSAILFFSTSDSTRSQMAQGFFRAWADPQFAAVSTAVEASKINPRTAEIIQEAGIDISGQKPRTVKESFRQHFVVVIAMCEIPRERCPIWPFSRNVFTWNIHDPEAHGKLEDEIRKSLRKTREEISAKVKELISETLPSLTSASHAVSAGKR